MKRTFLLILVAIQVWASSWPAHADLFLSRSPISITLSSQSLFQENAFVQVAVWAIHPFREWRKTAAKQRKQGEALAIPDPVNTHVSTPHMQSVKKEKPIRTKRGNYEIYQSRDDKRQRRKKDVLQAVLEQFRRSPLYLSHPLSEAEEKDQKWHARHIVIVLLDSAFAGDREERLSSWRSYFRGLAQLSGDPQHNLELYEALYLESMRQSFLSILRHPDNLGRDFFDSFIDSLETFEMSIPDSRQANFQLKKADVIKELLLETISANDEADAVFGAKIYLLSQTKNVPSSHLKVYLSDILHDASRGERDNKAWDWKVEKMQNLQTVLFQKGHAREIAEVGVNLLPGFYSRVTLVEPYESVAKRWLISFAEAALRTSFPHEEAQKRLDAVHEKVFPSLLKEHVHAKDRNDYLGWEDLSLGLMLGAVSESTSYDQLVELHRLVVESVGSLSKRTREIAQKGLPDLEQKMLRYPEGHKHILSTYRQVIADFQYTIFLPQEKAAHWEVVDAKTGAAEGVHYLHQHVPGSAAPLIGAQSHEILRLLPTLIERLEPQQNNKAWFRDFKQKMQTAETLEHQRVILGKYAGRMVRFFGRYEQSDFEFCELIDRCVFPEHRYMTHPIISLFSSEERFLLVDYLLSLPGDLNFEERESALSGGLDLFGRRSRDKVFSSQAEMKAANARFSYATSMKLSLTDRFRDKNLVQRLAGDGFAFVDRLSGLQKNERLEQELLRFKQFLGVDANTFNTLISRLADLLEDLDDNHIEYLQTINHILEMVRRPQPQVTTFDAPNEDDKLAITNFLLNNRFDPARLRAIFDVYFNSDEHETHKHIDRYELKFAQKNPGAFYATMPEGARVIHRQQDRKLDYNFFISFMRNFVDLETTTVAPEAEFFFKLLTSKKLHRYRSLKMGIRFRSDLFNSTKSPQATQNYRLVLQLLNKKYGLETLPMKALDERHIGARNYLSYQIAQDFTDWVDLLNDVMAAVDFAEKDPLARDFALEWRPRLLNAIEGVLHAEDADLKKAVKQFEEAAEQFAYFFRSKKLSILYGLFQEHVKETKEQQAESMRLLARYVARLPINESGKTAVDSLVEFVQGNMDRPEVVRVMHEALMREVHGNRKWRYESPDYLKMLEEWNKNGSVSEEAIEKVRKGWETNQYYTVEDQAGTGYIVGFTDDFFAMLNLGNPEHFGSCQATYKPTYNRSLSGYVANGWNKAIVVFDQKGHFISRRLVRVRLKETGPAELLLIREESYGNEAVDAWMDQLLAKVAHDMGVPYQPDKHDSLQQFSIRLWRGHSEWDYSDMYGKQLEGDVGLIHSDAEKALTVNLSLPLKESEVPVMDPTFSPVDEAQFRLLSGRVVEHSDESPTDAFRSSIPLKDFVWVGGEMFFRGVGVMLNSLEQFVPSVFEFLEGAPPSLHGYLYRDRETGKLHVFGQELPVQTLPAWVESLSRWITSEDQSTASRHTLAAS